VDKVALVQVFSEYVGFSCQSSFHQILHHHNHPGQATIGQSVAAVPSGPSWTPPPTTRNFKNVFIYTLNHVSFYASPYPSVDACIHLSIDLCTCTRGRSQKQETNSELTHYCLPLAACVLNVLPYTRQRLYFPQKCL
jgi:hypothetical protein